MGVLRRSRVDSELLQISGEYRGPPIKRVRGRTPDIEIPIHASKFAGLIKNLLSRDYVRRIDPNKELPAWTRRARGKEVDGQPSPDESEGAAFVWCIPSREPAQLQMPWVFGQLRIKREEPMKTPIALKVVRRHPL